MGRFRRLLADNSHTLGRIVTKLHVVTSFKRGYKNRRGRGNPFVCVFRALMSEDRIQMPTEVGDENPLVNPYW